MTPEMDAMSMEDLRTSADHLRAVLEAIDSGALQASGRQRAFIAGALLTLELALPDAEPDLDADV